MVEDIDLAHCTSIVEFGPGSGVVTRVMLERLPHGWLRSEGGQGTFIAVEFNPRMAQTVAHDFRRAAIVANFSTAPPTSGRSAESHAAATRRGSTP